MTNFDTDRGLFTYCLISVNDVLKYQTRDIKIEFAQLEAMRISYCTQGDSGTSLKGITSRYKTCKTHVGNEPRHPG